MRNEKLIKWTAQNLSETNPVNLMKSHEKQHFAPKKKEEISVQLDAAN